MNKGALFSDCQQYRYFLWRLWGNPPYVCFVGLNPSTADATNDDPTIRKCIKYARAWGYNGLYMANLFAYRTTHPEVMKKHNDPVGCDNDVMLKILTYYVDIMVAAWGTNGGHLNRDRHMQELIKPLYCLRVTKEGYPEHPLYLPGNLTPKPYAGRP